MSIKSLLELYFNDKTLKYTLESYVSLLNFLSNTQVGLYVQRKSNNVTRLRNTL